MATIKDMFPDEGLKAGIAEYLTAIEYRCDIKLTKAQLKLCQDYQVNLFFAAADYRKCDDTYYAQHTALEEVLKLKEPCFLETYFSDIFMSTQNGALLVSRYLAVSTPECIRNTLKSKEACDKKRASLEHTYEKYKEVYHFAKWYPTCIVDLDNVWRAAWYVMRGYDKVGDIHKFTTKQLKKALELPEAIDRYAQIEHRDYVDILNEQADLLNYIKYKLHIIDENATMHVFKTSEELAEEGMRMGNCIGTYWDHDKYSCLFAIDTKDEHMDVEIVCDDYSGAYAVWEVSQVFLAKNQVNKTSQDVMDDLEVIVGAFNKKAKDAWLEKVKPKKHASCIGKNCVNCICEYICGFSSTCKLGNPEYDCKFEAPEPEANIDDDLYVDVDPDDWDFKPANDDTLDDETDARAAHEYELMCHMHNVLDNYDCNEAGRVDVWETIVSAPDFMSLTTADVDHIIADYIDR